LTDGKKGIGNALPCKGRRNRRKRMRKLGIADRLQTRRRYTLKYTERAMGVWTGGRIRKGKLGPVKEVGWGEKRGPFFKSFAAEFKGAHLAGSGLEGRTRNLKCRGRNRRNEIGQGKQYRRSRRKHG